MKKYDPLAFKIQGPILFEDPWQMSKECCKTSPRLLEVSCTREEIAQAYIHTQRHPNNAWSEIISCFSCFIFIYSFIIYNSYIHYGILSFFKLALWPYSYLKLALWPYSNISIDDEQSNTLLPILSFFE